MLSCDQIGKVASVKPVIPYEIFFEQTEFLPKDLSFYCGDFFQKILKNKTFRSTL